MKLIIFIFLIFFQLHPYLDYTELHLINLNDSFLDDKKKEDNSSEAENQQRVYICTGQYAYAYHSRPDCPGLNNCKGDIVYTDIYTATYKLKRCPCCRCWSNVAGDCCDDNPYNQKTPTPQFNPYIQQLPIDAMVYVARQKQSEYELKQQQQQQLAAALEEYFSPKQVAIREKNREIRKINRNAKKYKNAKSKYEKNETKSKNDDYKYLTTLAIEFHEAPLRKSPRTKSEIIHNCSAGSIFFVLKTNNKHYCKVSVDNHTGYIAKVYLLRKN